MTHERSARIMAQQETTSILISALMIELKKQQDVSFDLFAQLVEALENEAELDRLDRMHGQDEN